MGSDHFTWPAHYEHPEEYWAAQERRHLAALEAEEERGAQRDVARLLSSLREKGVLRDDRLSHARICELEWETGIRSGLWSDYFNELREAQLKDTEGDT